MISEGGSSEQGAQSLYDPEFERKTIVYQVQFTLASQAKQHAFLFFKFTYIYIYTHRMYIYIHTHKYVTKTMINSYPIDMHKIASSETERLVMPQTARNDKKFS